MARYSTPRRRLPVRAAIAVLALVAHLSATFALPLPASSAAADDDGAPYPCRGHQCGCVSSEECWQGDCCCYTLEQKLAWADERGIEPPAHVRPLVEARRASRDRQARGASCCAARATAPCCQHHDSSACSERAAEHQHAATPADPSIRWVVGVFTGKCHNAGPGALHRPDLATGPAIVTTTAGDCRVVGTVCDYTSPVLVTPACPPVPPPRAA